MISFKDLGKSGRLGNQIFEIAATISLALDNNDSFVFPQWEYERFFNLHDCFSNNITNTETYTEPHFHYAKIPFKPNLNLSGYFKSHKYFDKHQDFIKKIFTTNYNIEPQPNTTSIHC